MDQDVLHQGVFFALQTPRNVADPYPFYQRLRSASPFFWDFVASAWFITRYNDVRAGLADQRFTTKNFPFDVTQLSPAIQRQLAPLRRATSKEVLHSDQADHNRLRRPLNRAFHPGALEPLRSRLGNFADELLGKHERAGAAELVRDFCEPIADYLFGELLSLPLGDRKEVLSWCDDIRKFTMMPRRGRATTIQAEIAAKSFRKLRSYFGRFIEVRRGKRVDDVIGRSVAVEGDETRPSDDEIIANCVFFLHSGVRNMAVSMTNGVYLLLRHPSQFATLRAHPQILPAAVEELLRYDPALQVVSRGVREEGTLGGQEIQPGQLLVFLLGAANRDPEQFHNPNRLDVTRHPNRHLSFGVGAHGCVGAWIARFGMSVALTTILDRGTKLSISGNELRWNFPLIRRELIALPLQVKPRRRRPRVLREPVSMIATSPSRKHPSVEHVSYA